MDALASRGVHVVGEQHEVAQDDRVDLIVTGLEFGGQRQYQRTMLRSAIVSGIVSQPGRCQASDRRWQRADRQVVWIMQQITGETDLDGIQVAEKIGQAQSIVYLNSRRNLN